MTVHLVKLCVGAASVDDLRDWQERSAGDRARDGGRPLPLHVTRMTPKRGAEIVSGGSMYWVIRGLIVVRQPVVELEAVIGADGTPRCAIWLAPELTLTAPTPRKAFQGWRYLRAEDAPPDLSEHGGGAGLPEPLRRELLEIGAW